MRLFKRHLVYLLLIYALSFPAFFLFTSLFFFLQIFILNGFRIGVVLFSQHIIKHY